jgi:NhaP-type Na+/H+ or K+/H+ antiporter
MIAPVSVVAVSVLCYALLSRRLASTVITAPIFFALVGLVVGPILGVVHVPPNEASLVLLLEAALVMVLFADSSGLDVRGWTREPSLSGRLLGIGLPLTMVAGTVAALLLFPHLAIWQAGLIGVILAPTDAALGQAVVANPRVSAVVRNALNVESGLNDGLALPFVTILIAVGLVAGGQETELTVVEVLVRALIGSTVVGLIVGIGGGLLIRQAAEHDSAHARWLPVALVALAVGAYSIADSLEASGFLAVWVAGLCTGAMIRGHVKNSAFHLPEQLADVLAAIGFLVLGAALLWPVLSRATVETVVYAVLSLTVVRMLPVAIAMLGTGFARQTAAYVGWFGPRGLASIVFAGVVVEAAVPNPAAVVDVVLLTVSISLVVHGVTAAWGARKYAAWFEKAAAAAPAIPEAAELPEGGVHLGSDRRQAAGREPAGG